MKGPPKTPTAVLRLRGSDQIDRRGEDAPAVDDEPQPCSLLDGESRKEWDRLTTDLRTRKMLSATDQSTLTAICLAWGLLVKAETILAKSGEVIKAGNGTLIPNPYVAIAKTAFDRWYRLMREFGLSPASRAGLGEKKKDAEQDAFAQWKSRKLSSS